MELSNVLKVANLFVYGIDTSVIGDAMPVNLDQGVDKSGTQTSLLVHNANKEYRIWIYDSVQEQWEDYGQLESTQRSFTFPWLENYTKIFFEAINPEAGQELRLVGMDGNVLIDGDPSDGITSSDTLFGNEGLSSLGGSGVLSAGPSGPSGPSGPTGDDSFTTFVEDGSGHIVPTADAQYNIGEAGSRLGDLFTANITTGDLLLNNKSPENPNIVDGTSGIWRIQEGENDLFIINEVNGKRYKFSLIEITQ